MCWQTNKKEECIGRIAEDDIKVYKIMIERNKRLYSWIKGFEYEIGKAYKCGKNVKPVKIDRSLYIINDGFHSYNSNSTFITEEKNYFSEKSWCVRSRNDKPTLVSHIVPDQITRKIKRINCIIPKGSIYYENDFGEIVSDQIIITND